MEGASKFLLGLINHALPRMTTSIYFYKYLNFKSFDISAILMYISPTIFGGKKEHG